MAIYSVKFVRSLSLACACLVFGSCGYQLGGTKPPALASAKTMRVCLFKNNSLEPRAATLVTGALADELQRDGTYKLSYKGASDVKVEGEVLSITFEQLRSSRDDTYKSEESGLRLTVKYRVTDCKTNKVLYENTVDETGQFYDVGNIQSSRTSALSFAARLIASDISMQLTNG